MFALMPLLLISIIIILLSLLAFWHLKQPQNAKSEIPRIEMPNDLQVWLLVLAAFVAGILIAYALFAPTAGG